MDGFSFPPKPLYLSPRSQLFKELDNNPNWIAERKINGKRVLIVGELDGVKVYTRHGRLIEIRKQSKIQFGTGLDGELEFKTKRMFLFDCFMYEGRRLWHFPLTQRKSILNKLALDSDMEKLTPVELNKCQFYQDCIKNGDEGIVLKRKDSRWQGDFKSSRKVSEWLKIKPKP